MDLSMPDDFHRTTWHHWLPLGPWMMLAMAVGTATHHDIDGSLQQVVDTVMEADNAELPHCGPLDGPLRWHDTDNPEDVTEGEERKQALAEVLGKAGHPMPTTTQELADLLVELGVLTHTPSPERWRLVLPMPLISQTLPLPEEARAREQRLRRYWDHKGSEQDVLNWAIDHVPDHDKVGEAPTTIRQLAADCDLSAQEVREGLALLSNDSDVTLLRHDQPLNETEVFALKDHQRFHIRMDWDAFSKTRITLQAAPRELDQAHS
ncbi:DUF6042 family protein [Nocardiopsis synnemataformans]|uniref:DUF6042 family protein n=1 Tax=Nocardiopsis synnemataformans TaxID=61305 RepID=UPI003EB89ADA